ncbi:hypothetical protein pRL70096 (plasmid) [Rhizobium johnstonii 3841]|uniref:Uncharacterized protein n=1 Tax=Rhizobium johnstonii (strain DSM 114642 / LMG 32736 / 3841) TaxID=216596 RepID=Q1M9T3_RHIJ3|nr:hypothetical protein pRL70096 [Rhizobium johnstonii 3841]
MCGERMKTPSLIGSVSIDVFFAIACSTAMWSRTSALAGCFQRNRHKVSRSHEVDPGHVDIFRAGDLAGVETVPFTLTSSVNAHLLFGAGSAPRRLFNSHGCLRSSVRFQMTSLYTRCPKIRPWA